MLVLVKVCCHVGMWTSAARSNVKFEIMRYWSPGCLLPQNSMPAVYSMFVSFRITAHFPYYIRFFVSITCTYPLRRSPSKLACVCWCLWATTSTACISMPDMVRHDICPHNYAVGDDWSSASVLNHTIVTDPTIWQPGFDLPHHTWSLLNRFWTGQGPCCANLHKWGLTQSPSCDRGQRQTMNHVVDTCPSTQFEGGLNVLNAADGDGHMAGIYSDCSTREMNYIIILNYTVSQKKVPTFKLSVTLSNLNRLWKLLHCWKAYKIC